MDLKIIEMTKSYEMEAKALILDGFLERFGFIDHNLNPDLNHIYEHYCLDGSVFLIGLLHNELVCTGALTKEAEGTGRIQRMSVKRTLRGKGLAKKMLKALEQKALNLHYSKLVLETNRNWESAINLYKSNGYSLEEEENQFVHLYKML
nr:GNAT family N-acetyltransferase [Cytobacillus gottheilii]